MLPTPSVIRSLILLALSCLVSVTLAVLRVRESGTVSYVFLFWNLFLALIPLGISTLLHKIYTERGRRMDAFFFLLAFAWLVFFPNAPYIVTDFLHLKPRQSIPLWFDTILIFSFTWNGFMGGFLSMRLMQILVHDRFGKFVSWLFVVCVCPLAALGVFAGRFLRWNSWDILRSPISILADLADQFGQPLSINEETSLIFIMTPILFLAYVSLVSFGEIEE